MDYTTVALDQVEDAQAGDDVVCVGGEAPGAMSVEAWATLNSDVSRPFGKPKTGRIAVKVINHLGDEVMKVFKVG